MAKRRPYRQTGHQGQTEAELSTNLSAANNSLREFHRVINSASSDIAEFGRAMQLARQVTGKAKDVVRGRSATGGFGGAFTQAFWGDAGGGTAAARGAATRGTAARAAASPAAAAVTGGVGAAALTGLGTLAGSSMSTAGEVGAAAMLQWGERAVAGRTESLGDSVSKTLLQFGASIPIVKKMYGDIYQPMRRVQGNLEGVLGEAAAAGVSITPEMREALAEFHGEREIARQKEMIEVDKFMGTTKMIDKYTEAMAGGTTGALEALGRKIADNTSRIADALDAGSRIMKFGLGMGR